MRFAKGTSVSIFKTKGEIEALLDKAGATAIVSGSSTTQRLAQVMFELKGRRVVFRVRTADPAKFARDGRGSVLGPSKRDVLVEAEDRRLWRCLLLSIKSKLECVESGIETFDEAFLAHVVMPDGSTVAEHAIPRIVEAYKSGAMVPLLPERTAP